MTDPAQPGGPQAAGEPAAFNPWAPPDAGAASGTATAPAPAPGLPPGPGATGAPPSSPAPDLNAGGGPVVPYWTPFPQPVPPPRNGLGTAAMTLGIVGTVLGLTFFFWVAWLPALLAVVLGSVALGHVRKGLANNRAMALAGVVLGVSGLLFSVGGGVVLAVRVHSAHQAQRAATAAADAEAQRRREEADRLREKLDAEEAVRREQKAAEDRKKALDEAARKLSFGGSYTFEETGLKVTLAAPKPFVPDESVFEAPKNAKVVVLSVTLVNTGSATLSMSGSQVLFVKDANGKLLFQLIDITGRVHPIPDSLAPGQSVSAQEVYALPNGTTDTISVQFSHGEGLKRREVVWAGSPG
ncbi:DUF4190 domain-containing protein [Kitasatospora terrestris]|uniref:DUF4190 domain-containing protein n=1 Tax=Kitasatospora terrestris TaxID=258051 RepID=A0ABP9DDH5_9ACTN